jgi:hypothetical protein
MLRFVLILVLGPVCTLAGVVGAMAGICAELGWPLSGPNFDDTVRWGIGVGVLGALLTALLLLSARRERLWWVAILGGGGTLLVSCASMWWNVVRSLG